MKKLVAIIGVGLLFLLLPMAVVFASNVSNAQYYGTIRISNNGTATTGVSTNMSLSTDNLITVGYLNTSANNCAIQNTSGADVIFMPAPSGSKSWCIFVPTITGYTYLNNVLYTTNVTGGDIRYFPGATGMVTTDAASMEPTDNFTLQLADTWIDISASDNFINKQQGLLAYTGSGNITVDAFGGTTANYTPDDFADAAGAWTDETLAFDNSVATTAYDGLAGPGWTEYLTIILPSQVQISGLYLYTLIDGAVDNVTADIYIDGAWVTVVPNQHQNDSTWTAYHFSRLYNTDRCRVRLYGDAAFARLSEIKFLPGAQVTATVASGEHDLYVGMDSPFFGMGLDPSTFELCVSENIIINVPLWQKESDNTTFTSIDSTQNPCTVSGAVWSDDGYTFDGADDYIEIPHNANQLLITGGSIEAWIKSDTSGEGSQGRILDKSDGLSGNNGYRFFTGANNVQFSINAGTTRASAANSVVNGDGNWYHVAATWDNAGFASLYVNGVLSGTPGVSANPTGITTGNVTRIGNRSTATDRSYDGLIGEVRVYSIELSAAQVLQNYTSTKSKYTTGDIYQYSTLLSVYDSANDWYVGGDSTHYIGQYMDNVGGNLVQDISWEYAATFTDASGNGNDATPSYRTGSSDPDVSAMLLTFGSVTEADAPAYTLTDPPDLITTMPGMAGNFTTTGNYTYWGRDVIRAVAIASAVPERLPTLIMVAFGLLIISFSYTAFARSMGHGSLFIKSGIIFTVMCLLAAFRLLDIWQLYMFAVLALGITWMSRQREAY